jgi:hypothetical protein
MMLSPIYWVFIQFMFLTMLYTQQHISASAAYDFVDLFFPVITEVVEVNS